MSNKELGLGHVPRYFFPTYIVSIFPNEWQKLITIRNFPSMAFLVEVKRSKHGSISPTLLRKAQMYRQTSIGAGRCHSFSQKNYTQLQWWIGLEVTPNFYFVYSALYASKLSINLLDQRLLMNWWWNWPPEAILKICRK